MSDIAIRVNNVSKVYPLYRSNRDRLLEAIHPLRKKYHTDFYALKDVSFEVKKGEAVGIIGQNGSGKSTLLKIITGVLTPTSGSVEVNGRISSLLELGTGFNPEMTGIENVFFYGSINGISREEMERRLDDILSFADIGDFVYQPVKTYSSGMFVRLAFACAINVEPDILIVDEALAVGDAKFQRKCYHQFSLMKERQVTILFVSHDLETMKWFPTTVQYFHKGNLKKVGDPISVIIEYLRDLSIIAEYSMGNKAVETTKNSTAKKAECIDNSSDHDFFTACYNDIMKNFNGYKTGLAHYEKIRFIGIKKDGVVQAGSQVKLHIHVKYQAEEIKKLCLEKKLEENLILGLHFETKQGIFLFALNTALNKVNLPIENSDQIVLEAVFNMPLLKQDEYFLTLGIALGSHDVHEMLFWAQNAFSFKVLNQNISLGLFAISYNFSIKEKYSNYQITV